MTIDTLIVFKVISNFVLELAEYFANKNKSLKLYRRLLKHVTVEDETHMNKHIDIFKNFCVSNRDALLAKDSSKIVEPMIKFSDKVFINMNTIFSQTKDEDTKGAIWQHLLTISAYVDPEGNAKEILKTEKVKSTLNADPSQEANFLTNMIEKIQSSVDTSSSSDPKDVVSNILGSGLFSEVLSSVNSSVEDGSLDLGKLMNTVQSMVSNLGGEGAPGEMPDLSSITQMFGSIMPPKVEEIEDK